MPDRTTRPIIWKGSPNIWYGRDGEEIEGIVDHIMAGTMGGTLQTFEATISEVSAHFAVSKLGTIWQYVREEDTAWGNGILENPDLTVPFLEDAVGRGVNPNKVTISIEHEGFPGDIFSEEQYLASLYLHRYLITRHPKLEPDRKHIIGHYQIQAYNRANCPGPSFPWSRLMSDLNDIPIPTLAVTYTFQDPVTAFWVIEPFASFYARNGGLSIFGRPIGPMTKSDPHFPGLLIQNFERARLEQPDAWAGTGRIQLGLVNTQLLSLQS